MKFPGICLRLATSPVIRQWAQRQLPNGQKMSGQVLNAKTVNYQTLQPERDGLFCERIFGPVQDALCACGRPPLRGEKFCPSCEVEYISSRVRRYRLGYIQLKTAAAHIWFYKGRPNFLSIFLNLSRRKVEGLLYCTENIARTIYPKEIKSPKSTPFPKRFVSSFPFFFEKVHTGYWCFHKTKRRVRPPNQEASHRLFHRFETVHKERLHPVKKSYWQQGGVRDSALFFGLSLVSKMLSWHLPIHWFCCVYYLIQSPKKGDILNKFYPGPPGIVYFWGYQSRLFCFTGAQLIRTWLTQLMQNNCHDGRLLEIQMRLELMKFPPNELLSENEWVQKMQCIRRLKYLRYFHYTRLNPTSMVLNVLPVLPPDLRPILPLDPPNLAVADLNKLYKTVILRNQRFARLTVDQTFHCLNSEALQYAQRLLQESIDALIDNEPDDQPNHEPEIDRDHDSHRVLKSLSDLFKGKKGRFRQNLLGKRVDYSGRSVIVVGPYLKIYECGLPQELAYELFQPFLLRKLLFYKKASTIFGAKKLFKQKPSFLLDWLTDIVHNHPIVLNRAPTLHRLSIQAFQPRLIEGKAILLHPLVCAAFNADFDGDQMGVHLPLCFEARSEAWKILWSQNHLFSVATGEPVCLPSQDMILGSCFLTMQTNIGYNFLASHQSIKNMLFDKPLFLQNHGSSPIFTSYQTSERVVHEMNVMRLTDCPNPRLSHFETPLWCSHNPHISGFETEEKKHQLFEIRLTMHGYFQKYRSYFYQHYHSSGVEIVRKIRTTLGRWTFYDNLF
uniref:DNA-directed RNA polymerase subunit n=1 Tax=Boodleopsis pusilla TaxID=381415 RepID=A0A386AZE0_9CHLO|nr:RNA polymerase b-subunit [Boodleopsis pusilla]AYC64801.1 RNA polymerase b-subunit [Boodleopsis pusilla]